MLSLFKQLLSNQQCIAHSKHLIHKLSTPTGYRTIVSLSLPSSPVLISSKYSSLFNKVQTHNMSSKSPSKSESSFFGAASSKKEEKPTKAASAMDSDDEFPSPSSNGGGRLKKSNNRKRMLADSDEEEASAAAAAPAPAPVRKTAAKPAQEKEKKKEEEAVPKKKTKKEKEEVSSKPKRAPGSGFDDIEEVESKPVVAASPPTPSVPSSSSEMQLDEEDAKPVSQPKAESSSSSSKPASKPKATAAAKPKASSGITSSSMSSFFAPRQAAAAKPAASPVKPKAAAAPPAVEPSSEKKEKEAAASASAESSSSSSDSNINVVVPFGDPNFHPIRNAIYKKGEKTPYLHLAKAFAEIEEVTSRLKIIEILRNCFRTIIALSPNDLLAAIYLCTNRLAPAHEGIELGIGEKSLIKPVCEATGRTPSFVSAQLEEVGDLGIIAQNSRATQRTMFASKALTIEGVFNTFRTIANIHGKESAGKKLELVTKLLVACRDVEPRFVIRSLICKLRIGLAEKSVVVALAHAVTMTPPERQQESPAVVDLKKTEKMSDADFEALLAANTDSLRRAYSELPNYDLIIPILLRDGFEDLNSKCTLTPGTPVSPMLAKPTNGISQVLDRFADMPFTCEYKYDGERAQLHMTEDGKFHVFSRNSKTNTNKYVDVIQFMPQIPKPESHVTSFIIDSEVVAYDIQTNRILPFQKLSTRGRKEVDLDKIKVKVVIYGFDLLYLNGEIITKKPLRERRRLLREMFRELPGQFDFARSTDAQDTEEIQTFLHEAIADNCEGLMVKTLDVEATYEPSKRSNKWLKVKKDYMQGMGDSLDLVPIGAYYGRGKRTGTYGAYLLACYDDETEQYQTICKLGTGFSDENLTQFTEYFKERTIPKAKNYYSCDENVKPDVWFEDCQVWEIKAADLSISPVHRAAVGAVDDSKGIALRFPRFIRIRDDKAPHDATTATQVVEMYQNQAVIGGKNGASGSGAAAVGGDDEDYDVSEDEN